MVSLGEDGQRLTDGASLVLGGILGLGEEDYALMYFLEKDVLEMFSN